MSRYKITFALLKKLGKQNDTELRRDLCYQASSGRTESLKDLTDMELVEVNNHLRRISASMPVVNDESLTRMRRKFFSICYDLRWTKSGKLDYARIHAWVNKYGHAHKAFNDYTTKELPELITQLESVLRYGIKKSEDQAHA